jgi:phosphoserine phosphatase RsbU/P
MMTRPTATVARPDPALAALGAVLAEYGRAHRGDAWVWQRSADGWAYAAGTAEPPHQAPGPSAVPIRNSQDAVVEVEGEAEEAKHRAAFLANVLGQLLQHGAEARFFGRELAERYEEITLLYTISEILGSVISLQEAAGTILKEVSDTMGVRRAALWILDAEHDRLELVAAVGGDGQRGPIDIADDSSVTAAVFRERRPVILGSGDAFPRKGALPRGDRDSFLSVPVTFTPLHGQPRTIGVINLIGRTVEEGFSAGDQKLITAIASQIGAAVANNRLVAESLRQERMDREMELAHDLQLKLLPPAERFRDRAEVALRCVPADSVGGDFYHLFRLPDDRLGVLIGDVSSHGFAAALIMALTMSAIAIHAAEGDAPAEVLRRVHGALIDELESTEMYLTLFYGVIDPAARRLTYANAGHPHAFRITAAGARQRLPATNPPFGIIDLADYREESTEWRPGEDILLLFTDGLSDAVGPPEGERRLVDLVAGQPARALEETLQSLFELDSQGAARPSDDRTAVLVRV